MLTGIVNEALEARLRINVQDASGRVREIDAVIDSGFNGSLTLPSTVIEEMGLAWLYREQGQLADGSIRIFDVHAATIQWGVHATLNRG